MAVRIQDGSGTSLTSTSGALDINVKSSSGTSNVAVTNFPATQPVSAASLPLPTGASQDGVDGTGITAPTGGSGIRGWLSGIYKALTGTLTAVISGTVAVTGTFWQATQPVSAASLPLPANASQETGGNLAAAKADLDTLSGTVAAGKIGVTVSNFPATQPVSATSLPLPAGAAQDGVDGTGITAPTGGSGIRGWLSGIYKAVTGTLTTAISGSVAVTGTFFQATQPVSAASLPLPTGAATDASVTNGNQKTQLVNGSGVVADVNPKGTQGAEFVAVQQPKDTGRTKIILTLTKGVAITTEALVTLTIKKGDGTTSTGTSYTITAGKTLRLQAAYLSVNNATATAAFTCAVRLREGAAAGGALALTSDIIAELEAGDETATLNTGGQSSVSWPDGMEITGGQQIGVSELSSSVDGAVTICIYGYEY